MGIYKKPHSFVNKLPYDIGKKQRPSTDLDRVRTYRNSSTVSQIYQQAAGARHHLQEGRGGCGRRPQNVPPSPLLPRSGSGVRTLPRGSSRTLHRSRCPSPRPPLRLPPGHAPAAPTRGPPGRLYPGARYEPQPTDRGLPDADYGSLHN